MSTPVYFRNKMYARIACVKRWQRDGQLGDLPFRALPMSLGLAVSRLNIFPAKKSASSWITLFSVSSVRPPRFADGR
jgi:hypothetical protein